MNNEEKILSVLDTLVSKVDILTQGQSELTSRVDVLTSRVDILAQGQTDLTARIDVLAQGQSVMQADISDLKTDAQHLNVKLDSVESIAQATHNNLIRLENDYQPTRGALFDKLDVLENKTDAIAEDVSVIKERLDTDELYIRVFDKKLRQVK